MQECYQGNVSAGVRGTARRVLMSNGFESIRGMEMEQKKLFSLCKEGKICVGYKYL